MDDKPKARGGRPVKPPEDKAVIGAIRATPAQWEEFKRRGGAKWFRAELSKPGKPAGD